MWIYVRPTGMNKRVTKMHPNHKKEVASCKECVNEKLLEINKILPCPNCGLYALCLSKDEISLKYGADIYCGACLLHWGRTNRW